MAKKIFYHLVILGIVAFLFSCKGQTKESMVQEGVTLMSQGNPLGAIVLFNNALEEDPNFVEARYQLALAYQSSGKFEKAEKELQKVRLQDPAKTQILLDLVGLHLTMKKIDEAEVEIKQFLEKTPPNSLSQEYRGRILAARGDLPGAEEAFRDAIELDEKNISARLELVQIYLQLNWTDEARTLLNTTREKFPEDKRVYFMLAALESRLGNKKEALAAYQHVSRIDPNDVGALYMAGVLALNSGSQTEAQRISDDLRKKFPEHPASSRLAGLINFAQGNFESAATEIRKSLQGMPDLSGYYSLGLAEYRLGHFELALSQFERALDIQPNHLVSRLMVATTLLRQKRFEESIEQATKVLEANSENAMAHNVLGSAYLGKGDFDKGMEHLNRASTLDPTLVDVHLKKGLLNLSKGDQASAEFELTKAIEVAPDVLNSRVMLASLYLRQKKYQDVIRTLKDGLKGSEQDALLYNYMAAAYFAQKQGEQGIEALQKAKGAKKNYLTPYFNLANYYISVGNRDKAIEEYQAILTIDPKHVKSLISLAALREIMGDGSSAKANYEAARNTGSAEGFLAQAGYCLRNKDKVAASEVIDAAFEAYPIHPAILELRGKLLLENNNSPEAIEMFKGLEQAKPGAGLPLLVGAWLKIGDKDKALELAQQQISSRPDNDKGYLLLSAVYQHLGEINQAEITLKNGLDATREAPALSLQLGTIAASKGKTDQAIEILSALQESNPDFVQATFVLGTLYDQLGKKKKAVELYQNVLSKDEGHVAAMNNLAYLYAENYGSPEEGLSLAIKAFRSEPANPGIMDTLGYVLLKNGKTEEAINVLNKAAELLPKVPAVRLHQGQALLAGGKSDEAYQVLKMVVDLDAKPEAEQASKLLQSIK